MTFVKLGLFLAAFALGGALPCAAAVAPEDPLLKAVAPDSARRWLGDQGPLHVFGNTYLVGFAGLNVGLIRTKAGLILIDGALPQGVPTIEARIAKLGLRVGDIRYILSTEPHFDHASGIAALARDSGATVLAGKAAVADLATGKPGSEDPQQAWLVPYAGISRVRGVANGTTFRLGEVVVKAVATPGHTPGSTSWTWRSCERARCRTIVFASSLNPIAAPHYRFSDPAHRGLADGFRRTFATMKALPCDILITAHPDQSGGDVKAAKLQAGGEANPFIDPGACRAYAAEFERNFEQRLADEKAGRAE